MYQTSGVLFALALFACGGGGDHSITKVDFSRAPRPAGGIDYKMIVHFTCPTSDSGWNAEGKLLYPAELKASASDTFRGNVDVKTGKGSGTLELFSSTFAFATGVEITCDGGKKLTAPVKIAPSVYTQPGGGRIHLMGTGIEFEKRTERGGNFLVAPTRPGFSFELDGVKAISEISTELRVPLDPSESQLLAMTTAQVGELQPVKKKVTYKVGTVEGSFELEEMQLSLYNPLVKYVSALADTLEKTAKSAAATPGPGKTVIFWNHNRMHFFGPPKPLKAVELMVVEDIVSKGRVKNCGTYADASGKQATFTVQMKDSVVKVYDLASKTIVATKTFRGSGSCPKSFVSENGQSGSSGGYAETDDVIAYAKTFAI